MRQILWKNWSVPPWACFDFTVWKSSLKYMLRWSSLYRPTSLSPPSSMSRKVWKTSSKRSWILPLLAPCWHPPMEWVFKTLRYRRVHGAQVRLWVVAYSTFVIHHRLFSVLLRHDEVIHNSTTTGMRSW
jgi:hypothetical protein